MRPPAAYDMISAMQKVLGNHEAGKAERTVSATQTVWERSLSRADTSEAIWRSLVGGKSEAIMEAGSRG